MKIVVNAFLFVGLLSVFSNSWCGDHSLGRTINPSSNQPNQPNQFIARQFRVVVNQQPSIDRAMRTAGGKPSQAIIGEDSLVCCAFLCCIGR